MAKLKGYSLLTEEVLDLGPTQQTPEEILQLGETMATSRDGLIVFVEGRLPKWERADEG